jgi:hypothetical protein
VDLYASPYPHDAWRRIDSRFLSCTIGQLAEGFGHPEPADAECGVAALEATKQRLGAPG